MFDLPAVVADPGDGTPVATIAPRHGISAATIDWRIAERGIEQDVPLQRKSPVPR